jgi:membrane protease YdiL (CAAX protease family)
MIGELADAVSAAKNHLALHSVLLGLVIAASAIDFLRFRSITFPLVFRWRRAIFWVAGLLLASLAVLALAGGLSADAAVRSALSYLVSASFAIYLFFSGYVWVRRNRWRHGAGPREGLPRQDLLWKAILTGSGADRRRSSLRKRLLLGVGLGLLLTAASYAYMLVYLFIFNSGYAEAVEKAIIRGRPLAAVVLFVLLAPFWEEVLVRWYALNALGRLFRRLPVGRLLAVVFSAAFWAVGHAYIEPVWVKEGQIFCVGLALGWLFPYLGLEGCIAAHLVLNLLAVLPLIVMS